jgi:hypothetical protein
MNWKYEFACFTLTGAALAACSSSNKTPATTTGVVTGAVDTHCAGKTVTADPTQCKAKCQTADGGTGDACIADFGDTMFNSEGDDDDCKYHVKWSSSGVAENTKVNFTVTVTNKNDGAPVTKAPVHVEAFLTDTQPAADSGGDGTEGAAGVYTVAGVVFNAPGQWTVRFHIHDECNDTEESPHGHAAFFVQVP